jgi:anti-sigma B factor antagonist
MASTLSIVLVRGIFSVAGELDVATGHQLAAAVQERFPPGHPVVLDLRNVTFCDSSGLTAMLNLRARAGGTADDLVIRNPHQRVRDVLEVTGVDQIVTVQTDNGADTT